MIYECANAFFFWSLNKIGGVESHFYYMAKKYGEYDVAFFYKGGDFKQIKRLRKYARCYQITDQDVIECEKFFTSYNTSILNQVKANENNFVIHGDYLDQVKRGYINEKDLPIDDRIDNYYGVSQLVCDNWEKLTGIKCINLYQPLILDEVEKPLKFVSATRLTQEKGWNRMVKLANEMDKAEINYLWYIFTNSTDKKPTKNMIFEPSRLDITDKLGGFDAFIQLSDSEAYCFSVVESLLRNVPVIVTDLPVFQEIGLNDSNSIRLPLDMREIPMDRIRNIDKVRFTYNLKKDRWGDVLIHKPSRRRENRFVVKATDYWQRISMMATDLGYIPEINEEWEVTEERLNAIEEYERENHVSLIKWRYKDGKTEERNRPETV